MGWYTESNKMRIVKILRTMKENARTSTLFFEDELCSRAKPGQFVMIWIPGVDEIPLSLSSVGTDGFSSVTVAEVGDASKALRSMVEGDYLGVRGPFGNSFEISGKDVLVIGGGTGMASLLGLLRNLKFSGIAVTIVEGARTKEDLLFLEQMAGDFEMVFATEDGSFGFRGKATEIAKEILSGRRFDTIYSCGPEKMIREVFFLSRRYDIPLQTCLERIMRCGVGICGSCVIGKYRVCRDGPIFSHFQLEGLLEEIGRYKLDFSGTKIKI